MPSPVQARHLRHCSPLGRAATNSPRPPVLRRPLSLEGEGQGEGAWRCRRAARAPGHRIRSRIGALVLSLTTLLAVEASAQTVETAPPPPHTGLPVLDDAPGARRLAHRPPEPCLAPASRFEVTYRDFPDAARGAFQAAVDTWACRIESPLPIRIDARWRALDGVTLGSAGPFLHRNFDGAPAPDTWYPAAIADLYAGRDLAPDRADIEATFNAAFRSWDLTPETPPLVGEYDLYTVVLHEIGHGLGLIGGFTVENGIGTLDDGEGADGAYAYDRLAVDDRGQPLLDAYPPDSRALGDVLRSAVGFEAPAVRQVLGGAAPLYAPSVWVSGGSYSHLDEDAFPEGEADGLMTPFIRPRETVAEPGAVTCAMLADLGWLLAGDCAARVGPLPGVEGRLLVFRDGPNPVRTATRFRVVGSEATRADLLDVLGRVVRRLDVRPAGERAEVTVEAAGLASGLYLVRLADGEAVSLQRVTVVR